MKEILDIGAGRWPAPGATRAVDIKAREELELKGAIQWPSSLQEYKFGIRAEQIPYPDGFFNKVISRWALGPCITRRAVYREIARVLKPQGRVEVRLLWKNRRYYRRIVTRLAEAGIDLYNEYRGVYIHKDGHRLSEFIICARKNGGSP